jgi:hypothetical protein
VGLDQDDFSTFNSGNLGGLHYFGGFPQKGFRLKTLRVLVSKQTGCNYPQISILILQLIWNLLILPSALRKKG